MHLNLPLNNLNGLENTTTVKLFSPHNKVNSIFIYQFYMKMKILFENETYNFDITFKQFKCIRKYHNC